MHVCVWIIHHKHTLKSQLSSPVFLTVRVVSHESAVSDTVNSHEKALSQISLLCVCVCVCVCEHARARERERERERESACVCVRA